MQNYRRNYCQMPARREPVSVRNTVDDLPIGMAYVPWQTWREIYDAEKGLCQGTIFKELDLPFLGKGGRRS